MLKLCVICFCIGKPFKYEFSYTEKMRYTYAIPYLEDYSTNLCPKCENKNTMIPIDTTRAKKIIKEYELVIKEYVRPIKEKEKFVWEKDDDEK